MKLIQHVWMACIGLCLFSCTQTDELETAQGKTGFIVSLTDGTKLDVSRATPGDIVDSEGIEGADFNLRIVNAETEGEIYNDKVGTEVIKAYSGVYDLTATYGENPVLALDAPYFKGETTGVEVFNDQITQVTIACKVANALVSVTYDNSKASFDDVYSNYYVEVKVGEESVEIKDVAQSAYMQAGSAFEVIFHGTIDGTDKAVTLGSEFEVPTTLNAGDHLKLTLSPKLDRFDIPLSIEGVNVVEAPLTEEIPMEWLPKPKVEAEGFTDNELSFVETEQKDAKLNLTLSSALQDIKFKFNFEDEQERFTSLDKEKEYFLSTDKEFIEQALGITLPAVGEKPESIDLSGLIAKLQTNAGEPTTNTIEIDVQANDRWSSEDAEANRVYTLTCNKPEFSIAVQPGNCWSREFTIDEVTVLGNADAEKIKSQLVYQYYNGTEWVECTTREENGRVRGRTQQFEEAAENIATKTYKVRALYRDAITSAEVDATLETPEQLPNSDMEEWWIETLTGGLGTYYHYNPYSENEADIWWTTNNDRAADPPVSAVEANSCPSVSYVIGRNGGRAVELRTTAGSHYAHTNSFLFFPATLYSEGIVSGMLFIGNYTWNNHETEVITPGHAFAVRPTDLEFYYKYQPLNVDEFKAYVEVWNVTDGQTTKLADGTFTKSANTADTNFELGEIHLNYVRNDMIATHIYVHFWSTTKDSFSDSDVVKDAIVNLVDISSDWKAHIGSRLQIDDISLKYDK